MICLSLKIFGPRHTGKSTGKQLSKNIYLSCF